MKKILVFILCGISFGAMAKQMDYKTADGFICATVDREVNPDGTTGLALEGQNAKIQLFFDKGGSGTDTGLHNGCEAEYKKVYAELLKAKGNIEELVFIGSADQQNASGQYDNRALAQRRADYAASVLGGGKDFSYREYVVGDEDAKTFSPTIDNIVFRSVNVYVVWRLAKCPAEFVESIAKYEKQLRDAIASGKYANDKEKLQKALDGVIRAKKLCTSGRTLMASEVEQLLKEVYGLLIVAGDIVPEVNVTNTNVGINTLQVESSIDLYYSNLLRLRDGLGLSEWRDENGDFNTARLVSDSVAGVVLGTVGGIVTSKLVKKNQLKKGFEDLSCTVGGQRVADYGDDFTVGLR